jgi:hypothetical protein
MQSGSNTSTQRNAHTNSNDSSVNSSIAAFATEAKHDAKGVGGNLSFNNDKSSSPDTSMQFSSVEDSDLSRDQCNAETVEQISPSFHADSSESDSRTKKVLKDLGRYRDSRTHNPPLLLDDLKELGMAGDLSEDSRFVNMTLIASFRP